LNCPGVKKFLHVADFANEKRRVPVIAPGVPVFIKMVVNSQGTNSVMELTGWG
jgi:hypothetical protein